MVDLSAYFDAGDIEADEDGGDAESQDLEALKACLRALADAIASTNLAVINGAQGELGAAGARVQASVTALKRFHESFQVLNVDETPKDPEETPTT